MSAFTKAFVGPAVQQTFAVTQQYAAARFGPPLPPPDYQQVPEEPYQYLPPRGPYSTGGTWGESCGAIASMAELTALFIALGAFLGLTAGLCVGQRQNEKLAPQQSAESEVLDSDTSHSEQITNFSGWAEKHYEKASEDPEEEDNIT